MIIYATAQTKRKKIELNPDKLKVERYSITEYWLVTLEPREGTYSESIIKNAPFALREMEFATIPVSEEITNKIGNVGNIRDRKFVYHASLNGEDFYLLPEECKMLDKKLTETKPELITTFVLQEIDRKEISKIRRSKTPIFVFKTNNKFYFSEINPKIRFVSECNFGFHMCSSGSKDCKRLSAASDECGGCARIRDIHPYIENYAFISSGFQTVNCEVNSFVVLECKHYAPCPPRKQIPFYERRKLNNALREYIRD